MELAFHTGFRFYIIGVEHLWMIVGMLYTNKQTPQSPTRGHIHFYLLSMMKIRFSHSLKSFGTILLFISSIYLGLKLHNVLYIIREKKRKT